MTVVLREWETFAGSNTPVVGATVNARVASSTHPSAAAIVASTTTNASGMWEFTSLADATYDVDITYNGRTRWRKGLSLFSNAMTGANFATQTANKIFGGPASGAVATPTFRDLVSADFPAALWSAWIPVSTTQGVTPTRSNTLYRVCTQGKLVNVQYFSTFTSAGTASSNVLVNLPAALQVAASIFVNQCVGSGVFFDASGSSYFNLAVLVTGVTQFGFAQANTAGLLGSAASTVTIANGDILSFVAHYETT